MSTSLPANNFRNQKKALTRILWLRTIALLIAFSIAVAFEHLLDRHLITRAFIFCLLSGVVLIFATWLRLKRATPVSEFELVAHLILDATLLVTMVQLTGGATNPFIYYYLVLIAIAAAALKNLTAWLYCGSAVLAYSMMMFSDLSGHAHHEFNDFQLHLLGMWLNFGGSAILMCFFVSRFATALRDQEVLLASAREENLKNEQLVSVATLAASTAHNLGTPLNSISILLSDFDIHASKEDMKEDLALALSQVQRAKHSLQSLGELAEPTSNQFTPTTLRELKQNFEEHYHLINPHISPQFNVSNELLQASISSNITLRHALINLIDNAIRAARERVTVEITQQHSQVQIHIEDDGLGFTQEQLDNWGLPSTERSGLGIGIFLANHTIEKAGGSVIATRREQGLTRVSVELPTVGQAEIETHR